MKKHTSGLGVFPYTAGILCQFYKWESYYVFTEQSAEVDCKSLGTI